MTSPREVLRLDTRHVGRRVLVRDSVTSTNDLATALAGDPSNDGTVIIASVQSAGRGQYGRSWQSRPRTSVLMSVILRPPSKLRRPVVLTAWAAVGVADAVYQHTGLQARIKWPNDLLLSGRKVCGILIEQSAAVAVGIGLNVNQTKVEFAEAGLPDATSMAIADGIERDPLNVAISVVRRLDDEYDRLGSGELVPLESEWKWRVGLLGRRVRAVLTSGSSVSGRLRELTFDRLEIGVGSTGTKLIRPEQIRQLQPTD